MSSPSESQSVQTTHAQTQPEAAPPHGDPHAHEHAAAPVGPHFSEKEWKEFRDDDIHAGGAVVCLMAGIFTVGLMLYTTIALIVSG